MIRPSRHRLPQHTASRAAGYTLVELMIAMTVAVILGSIAVPTMRTMLLNGRLTSATNDLLAGVNRARTEALKQQLPTVVCFTADPTATTPACDYTAARGWIVFVDSNGDWAYESGEQILERHPTLHTAVTVKADGDGIVAFSATGFATPSGAHQALRNVTFCDARGVVAQGTSSSARALIVATTGRARAVASVTDVTAALAGRSCP
ncbi:MAG: GspH/FimT family pseudopilin [Pseudomonadota bacterium]|jgi:type IV fimbrial biogenesis protein FimT